MEQHRHRIVDMSGRNVPVRVTLFKASISLFSRCVDHYRRLVARCARLGDTCRLPFAHDPANAWVDTLGSSKLAIGQPAILQRPSPRTARRRASRIPPSIARGQRHEDVGQGGIRAEPPQQAVTAGAS